MQYRENMKTAPLARVKQKGSAKMAPVDKRGKRQKRKRMTKKKKRFFFKKKIASTDFSKAGREQEDGTYQPPSLKEYPSRPMPLTPMLSN